VFLATDRASFVHGAILPVDGGKTAVQISSASHSGTTSASGHKANLAVVLVTVCFQSQSGRGQGVPFDFRFDPTRT
jgi:hypothetical protein